MSFGDKIRREGLVWGHIFCRGTLLCALLRDGSSMPFLKVICPKFTVSAGKTEVFDFKVLILGNGQVIVPPLSER